MFSLVFGGNRQNKVKVKRIELFFSFLIERGQQDGKRTKQSACSRDDKSCHLSSMLMKQEWMVWYFHQEII